jgi:hypothetical protein
MSKQPKDGGPAFPIPTTTYMNGEVEHGSYGMTLRDYFAGQAIVGIECNITYKVKPSFAASWAYETADAMLEARKDVTNGSV